MKNFKLNEKDILSNQDWTFPTTTYYGPGRFNEIAKFCEEFDFDVQNLAGPPKVAQQCEKRFLRPTKSRDKKKIAELG